MSPANHYEVLGVSATAPVSVIKAAHRALMREHHPDAGGGTDSMAKTLNEALRILANARLRADYDAILAFRDTEARCRGAASRAEADERARQARDAAAQAAQAAQVAQAAARATAEENARRAEERARAESRARSEAAARANANWFEAQDPTRLAGFNVFERNRINLSTMDWYTRDYPPLEIRDEPVRRASPARLVACFLLGINLVLTFLVFAYIVGGGDSPRWWSVLLLVLMFPVAALAGGWGRARARGRGLVRYVLFLGHAGGILVPALADGRTSMFVALCWIVLYVLTVESLRATAHPRRRPRTKRLLTEAEVRDVECWEPASPAMGHPAADGGIPPARIAELLTAQLLETLRDLPGTRTVGQVAFPEIPGRHVGHAVLCGDRLALIDSHHCHGGQYYWWENRLVGKLPGYDPEFLDEHFPLAVESYRRIFPELFVLGWSVFHSMDGVGVLTNNQAAGDNPRLVTASVLLKEIGNWLSDGQANVVDRAALSRLVNDFGQD